MPSCLDLKEFVTIHGSLKFHLFILSCGTTTSSTNSNKPLQPRHEFFDNFREFERYYDICHCAAKIPQIACFRIGDCLICMISRIYVQGMARETFYPSGTSNVVVRSSSLAHALSRYVMDHGCIGFCRFLCSIR